MNRVLAVLEEIDSMVAQGRAKRPDPEELPSKPNRTKKGGVSNER